MKLIDVYIGQNIVAPTILASLGLVGFLTLATFLDQLDDLKNTYTIATAGHFVLLSVPRLFYETAPYAMLIGSLIGLGQLAKNSELIVLRTSGMSTHRIAIVALCASLLFAVGSTIVGEWVAPKAELSARLIREGSMEFDISPGSDGIWSKDEETFAHFSVVNKDLLRKITVYYRQDNRVVKILWADSASYQHASEDGEQWMLSNVYITKFAADYIESNQLDSMAWNVNFDPISLATELLVGPGRMSLESLNSLIKSKSAAGLDTRTYQIGYWSKIFQPLSSLALVLISIGFVFGSSRETTIGRRVVTGLIVSILFKMMQDLITPASLVFGFPPLLAVLIPIAICLSAGIVLLVKAR